MPKNLDFLKDNSEYSLILAKNDINLYLSEYNNLSEKTNNLTKEVSEFIKKIWDL